LSLAGGGVWFPTIRAGTGVDQFTERLAAGLIRKGIRAEIAWLPHRAEYLPWTARVPSPPEWASVVHINSWTHQRFIPEGLPCLVTLHSCVHDPAFSPYKSRLQSIYHQLWVYRREVRSMQRAQIVTAVSDYTARIAKSVFPFKKSIQTIHNWIDTSIFTPVERASPNTPFRLLFVGSINMRKGRDLLVQIMARLGPDFELSYTGTPKDFPQSVSLPDNMISLGRIDGSTSMAELYQSHDALLFPSRLEGLPLSVLEAASSGLPVVAGNASSLPEVVRHQRTGILCPVNNVDAYVNAVNALANDQGRWLAMRRNARQWIESEFSMEPTLDHYIKTYQSMVG
jgi:glycosyltransferase involved in cell wall biosynthesis